MEAKNNPTKKAYDPDTQTFESRDGPWRVRIQEFSVECPDTFAGHLSGLPAT